MKKIILSMLLGVLLIISMPNVKATDISDCTEITSAGVYTLTANITDATLNKCMNVTVSDVILDCQGNTIDGIFMF